MSPIALIGAGAVILLIGVGTGFLLGRRNATRADDIQAELDTYRRDVTEHFGRTAAHFRAIGAEYRKLYDHMAAGEAALCDTGQGLAFKPAELLTDESLEAVPPQPRDYDIADTDPGDQELPEIVGSEAVLEPDVEPTDAELAETEKVEDLLAERDLTADDPDAEKTIH
jgi:uncharacterized membrane-anchored protein YhcB (DUF1043 family)